MTTNQELQNSLNDFAQVVRRYNLGGYKYFFIKLSFCNKSKLKSAWNLAEKSIQNREIIKDASKISINEVRIANQKAADFEINIEPLHQFLKSAFEVKKLKLSDENVERRLRKILAEKYLELLIKRIEELSIKHNSSFQYKSIALFNKFKVVFIALGIVGIIATPRIIDGLTPVSVLTKKIREKSKYKFSGSICNDGTISHSQGRGTCSWHGGVDYKFYKGDYSKTLEECRAEAIKLSWRD